MLVTQAERCFCISGTNVRAQFWEISHPERGIKDRFVEESEQLNTSFATLAQICLACLPDHVLHLIFWAAQNGQCLINALHASTSPALQCARYSQLIPNAG